MHGSSLARLAWFVRTYLSENSPKKQKVLDVGSCDVAGGNYRQFFDPARFEYMGLDMAQGPNVDIAPALPYCWRELADESFDVVISGQAFEHMEFFWLAAAEMARVLKSGGYMCIVAPRGFERHRYPVDCYRFDADAMVALARWCNLEPLHASTDMAPEGASAEWHIETGEDSLLVARKPCRWPGVARAENYVFREQDMELLHKGFCPCEKVFVQPALMADYHALEQALTATRAKLAESRETRSRELARKDAELAAMKAELAELRRRTDLYENSRSWRLTRPLRLLGGMARKALCRKK